MVLWQEEIIMIELKNEYIDIKNIKHTVKHQIFYENDNAFKEHILDALKDVLIKQTKKLSENSA